MTKFGLTVSAEEHPPSKCVEIAVAAEEAGFDFISISDHFHPWVGEQGHSPFVWSVLGAIAQATTTLEVGVGVSCPIMRIHPAISAHAAATTSCLLGDRFTWGVGTGEALNEHILGDRWPPAEVRLAMLEEAIDVIRQLWTGESVTHRGQYFTVEDARLYDVPDQPPPIVVSAFGPKAVDLAVRAGDGLWMTGPSPETVSRYKDGGGDGPVWTQLTVAWDPDEETAVQRAHEKWPNSGLPGQLAQDLRTVLHFEQAVTLVDAETATASTPCGPDPEPILESISSAEEAGADHIYLHQIGDPTDGFIDFWSKELQPAVTR